MVGAVDNARLPPLWPRFNSCTCHLMWVDLVVGSEGSPGYPVFLPPQKTSTSKFQFNLDVEQGLKFF